MIRNRIPFSSSIVALLLVAIATSCAPPAQVKPPDVRVPYDPARVSVQSGDSTLDLETAAPKSFP